MNETKQYNLNLTNRINMIHKKINKLLKEKEQIANIKEPVLMLVRRDRNVEYYEGIKAGNYKFEHSSGEEREILLSRFDQLNFLYGDDSVRGYIVDEDNSNPFPEDPLITSEKFKLDKEKTLADIKDYRTPLTKARGEMWYKIMLGAGIVIGVIIVGIILMNMLIPPEIINTSNTLSTVDNVSKAVKGLPTIIG